MLCRRCGEARDALAFEPGRKVCRQCRRAQEAAYRRNHPEAHREYVKRSYWRYRDDILAKVREKRAADPEKYNSAERDRRKRRRTEAESDPAKLAALRAKKAAQMKRWYAGLTAEERRAKAAPKRARIAALRAAARAARPPKTPKPPRVCKPRMLLTDAERAVRRRLKNQRKWAKRKGAAGKVTPSDIEFLEKSQRGRCFYCCAKFGADGYQIDHFEPLARGGSNYRSNLRLACAPCNLAKSDRPATEFMAMLIL